ncbi:MAG: hypothetical protein IKO41_18600 [Lachnospiraceae bacterium]|nr:hypothetical protein [Lachnospiraceae bacterium]
MIPPEKQAWFTPYSERNLFFEVMSCKKWTRSGPAATARRRACSVAMSEKQAGPPGTKRIKIEMQHADIKYLILKIHTTTRRSTYKNRGCEKISLDAIGHSHMLGCPLATSSHQ